MSRYTATRQGRMSRYIAFAGYRADSYDNGMDDIEQCRDLMNKAMHEAGLNPNAWAKKAKVSESGVRGFLSGTSPNISLGYLDKLAKAIGRRASDFMPRMGGTPELTPRDAALLDLFRGMPPEEQARFLKVADAMAKPGFDDDELGSKTG